VVYRHLSIFINHIHFYVIGENEEKIMAYSYVFNAYEKDEDVNTKIFRGNVMYILWFIGIYLFSKPHPLLCDRGK